MGRGNRSDRGAVAPARTRTARRELTPQERAQRDARYFIGRYETRVNARVRTTTAQTAEAIRRAKVDALGLLSAPEQRKLVEHIRTVEATGTPEGLNWGQRGRELMLLAHDRFKHDYASKHEGRGAPMASLLQACDIGMNKAIDKYDHDKGAGFLHYSTQWMHAEINDVIEHESGQVRFKSKSTLHHSRVEQVLKDFDNQGRRPSLAEVTDALNRQYPNARYTPEKVAEVYDWASTQMMSFDAPVDATDGGANLASVIADAASMTEEGALSDAQRDAVRKALNAITRPSDRLIMELYWGLGGREEVEQKHMFDGVYRDSDGNAFTGEDSVVNDRASVGETVQKVSQKELDSMFESGAITFDPGTPEARELFEAFGTPPTSGNIQYALNRARKEMQSELSWMRDDFRYRGDNELENSDMAQEEVRRALVALDAKTPEGKRITAAEARKLKVSRPGRDGQVRNKGPLRVMAEQYGLVDDRGRVRLDRVPAAAGPAPAPARVRDEDLSGEDFAEMMSA